MSFDRDGRPRRNGPGPDERDFSQVPPFIVHGRPLVRGTEEWEDREHARWKAGCCALSFGSTPSLRTQH